MLDFGSLNLPRKRTHDIRRHLVLQIEDVGEVAIIAVGPDVNASLSMNELAGDAHPATCLAHAAFQHVAHAKVAGDCADINGPALVGKGAVARDDKERAEA